MLTTLTLLLLHAQAWATPPCGEHSVTQTHADVAAAAEALPAAEQVDPAPPVRDATTAPFLAPLQRKDRGALAKLADGTPGAFALATDEEIATVVDMLQRGGTGGREERGIVALLEGRSDLSRAQILRLIDQGRDKYDLGHLVYDDVDDPGRRARLLQLIQQAGQAQSDAGTHELGIISDIDDTVAPLGSADHFPGAGALYKALEDGPSGRGQAGDIHYVTARPPLVMGDVYGRLDRAGVPVGTIDAGDLGQAIFRGEDGYEDEKVADIERLLSLHPGQRFVLIGDDTQRDAEVYRRILATHPDRIAGVFIHQVEGGEPDTTRYPPDRFAFFDDYERAAGIMAQRGLIAAER